MTMKQSSMAGALVVLVLFVMAVLHIATTQVEARPAPTFGQRRLLNLSGNAIEPTSIPTALRIAPGNELHLTLTGDGVQEYVFQDGTWTLFNASAILLGLEDEEVGEHFLLTFGAEPSWKSLSPESLITGAVSTKVTVSEESVPWLLVTAVQTSGASERFGKVTFVQRLNTENGLPPDASYAAKEGETYLSPYTATYAFYTNC